MSKNILTMRTSTRHPVALISLGLALWLATCQPATPSLTPGPAASPTGTPSPTSIPSPTPVPTPTPAATPDAAPVRSVSGEPEPLESHPSPDGNWRVDVVAYPCVPVEDGEEMAEQLILIDLRTGAETAIHTQWLRCDDGLGAFGLGGLFWSPGSQVFYFTDAREGEPDGAGSLCWERPLWALRANDATAERLTDVWARSPGGDWLALVRAREETVVQTLEGEMVTRVPIPPNWRACDIIWLPDGETFVYLRTRDPFSPGAWELFCVDARRGSQASIYELENAAFVAARWESPGGIVLTGVQNGERMTWPVEASCSTDRFAELPIIDRSTIPADVAAWNTNQLRTVDVTLPVPPGWVIDEWEGTAHSLYVGWFDFEPVYEMMRLHATFQRD